MCFNNYSRFTIYDSRLFRRRRRLPFFVCDVRGYRERRRLAVFALLLRAADLFFGFCGGILRRVVVGVETERALVVEQGFLQTPRCAMPVAALDVGSRKLVARVVVAGVSLDEFCETLDLGVELRRVNRCRLIISRGLRRARGV